MGALQVIVKQVLGDPAILIGLVAFLGLIIQGERMGKVLSGTLKTTIGLVIIGVGAGAVVGSLAPIGELIRTTLDVGKGVVPNNEAVISIAMEKVGSQGALIMVGGFIVNLILARFTRFKYIFLTGHIMLYISLFFAAVLFSVSGLSGFTLIVAGSICAGLYFTFMPALTQPFMRKIKGHDNIAFGHTGAIGNVISGWIGNLFSDSKDAEEVDLPEGLRFFRDSTLSMAVTMVPIFFILVLLAGPKFVEQNISGGTNFLVFSFKHGVKFAAGVTVILSGVRMMLAEIVPAFEGISQKVVPGARPALDCPIIFDDAPTALLIGFISSTIGTIVGMFILLAIKFPVITLPAIVPAFFAGGSAGIFGNSTGGWKGAVVGPFIGGILLSVGTAILVPMSGMLEQAGATFGDPFYAIIGPIFTGLLHLIGG